MLGMRLMCFHLIFVVILNLRPAIRSLRMLLLLLSLLEMWWLCLYLLCSRCLLLARLCVHLFGNRILNVCSSLSWFHFVLLELASNLRCWFLMTLRCWFISLMHLVLLVLLVSVWLLIILYLCSTLALLRLQWLNTQLTRQFIWSYWSFSLKVQILFFLFLRLCIGLRLILLRMSMLFLCLIMTSTSVLSIGKYLVFISFLSNVSFDLVKYVFCIL